MIIEELIAQKTEVAITLNDSSVKKGIITRQETAIIELEASNGFYVIPLNSIAIMFYEK